MSDLKWSKMISIISTDRKAEWDMRSIRAQWRTLIQRGCAVFNNDSYLSAILFCFIPPREMLALPVPSNDSDMKELVLSSFIRPMVSDNNAIATFFAAQVKMVFGSEQDDTLMFVGQMRTNKGVETYMCNVKIKDGKLEDSRPDPELITVLDGRISTFLKPIGPVVR